jgi:glycosyltransferase involved in cell wall biosynthesis
MKILLVHQNFPAQFLRLAPALKARGHEVLGLADAVNARDTSVQVLRYKHEARKVPQDVARLGRNFVEMTDRGATVARVAEKFRDQTGYRPDIVFGHPGWGETLFLKEIWPAARHLTYCEFYYRGVGMDVGFDPEFSKPELAHILIAQSRTAHLCQGLVHSDRGVAPTRWQRSVFPATLQPMIDVIHDGVDTEGLRPDPSATVSLPDGRALKAGDEVLTLVNRNLEPYRGFHVFMRALPEVLAARPDAQVVVVGGDAISYGIAPKFASSWREALLREVGSRIDLGRVHFLGRVAYPTFRSLMQVTRVHAYLTYPFVLSWSMLEAMSAGALVVGSRTAPVQEVIEDGLNGRLVDFFDIKGWSETLIRALAEPKADDPLRRAARETVLDRYDVSKCLPAMIDFVEGAAA